MGRAGTVSTDLLSRDVDIDVAKKFADGSVAERPSADSGVLDGDSVLTVDDDVTLCINGQKTNWANIFLLELSN